MIELQAPYLIFLAGASNPLDAKTGHGLVDWRPELCAGQLRYPGCEVDLGLPEMSVGETGVAGVGSLVIGVASIGGDLEPAWLPTLEDALAAGLDLVGGTHARLSEDPRTRTRS